MDDATLNGLLIQIKKLGSLLELKTDEPAQILTAAHAELVKRLAEDEDQAPERNAASRAKKLARDIHERASRA